MQVALQLGGTTLAGLLQGAKAVGICVSAPCAALRAGLAGSVALDVASVSLLRAADAGGPVQAVGRGGVVVDASFRVPARLAPPISAELQSAQYPRLLAHYLSASGFGSRGGAVHVGAPQLRTGQMLALVKPGARPPPAQWRPPPSQPAKAAAQSVVAPTAQPIAAVSGADTGLVSTPALAFAFCALLLVASRLSRRQAVPDIRGGALHEMATVAARLPHPIDVPYSYHHDPRCGYE